MQVSLRRVALVAAAAAAVAAAAVTLALQAPGTQAHSGGGIVAFVDKGSVQDAPEGPQFTQVARVNVPAGRYVLSGKALVTHRSNGVDCYLRFGRSLVDAASYGGPETPTAILTTLNVHAVVSSRARRGRAVLTCRAGDGTWDARDVKLSATRVDAVVQQ